ncbi:MAG: DinB family protein [Candidatus Thorarchaeota archaeon]|nr:MAG: DinB family protein [Candidatus Thorarchaeota archaeon]
MAAYHLWTGTRMRQIVEELREKEYTKKVMGKNSVKSICTHIVLALATCFLLADESGNQSVYDWIRAASKLELLDKWNQLDERLSSIIREIPQGTIEVPHISEETFEIELMDFYLQYLLHTTHHRGQLAMALRILKKNVPGTDYLMYFRDSAGL